MKKLLTIGCVLAAMLLTISGAAMAASIEYELTNISGTLWQYDYYLKDVTGLTADQGFTIYFDNHASNITLWDPSNSINATDWWVERKNPQGVAIAGYYDGYALTDAAWDYTGPFSVRFNWSGGTPGEQLFEIYNEDSSLVVSDMTSLYGGASAVPEPASGFLLLGGLAAFAFYRWKK